MARRTKWHASKTSAVPEISPEIASIKFIAKDSELQSLVDKNHNKLVPAEARTVGVHFQFATDPDRSDNASEEAVAIALSYSEPDEGTLVLRLASLSKTQVVTGLRLMLSDSSVAKVMYSAHQVAFWLHCYGLEDAELVNCVDLQLLYENHVDRSELNANMLQIAAHCSRALAADVEQSTHSFRARSFPTILEMWMRTPLPKKLLLSLSRTSKLYAQCYAEFRSKSTSTADTAAMTTARWEYAVANCGRPAIRFDPEDDSQPRSLECLVLSESAALQCGASSTVEVPELELQCELESLLRLIPSEYGDSIRAIRNYRECLIDICIDDGRPPFVYIGKKKRVVLTKDEAPVSKDTIDEILRNLGGEMRIGGDNRAGIDRQLHRISVMRSTSDEVYAFTMRVGRALRNAACVLTDLLLSERHADKSVLVLGYPGSGKTTIIRDVARCVSETMENVCIIDTSNEIGGDGLVPHGCVGWARRMMVRSLEAQAAVMIECVQNHTVETLIVDEIGRKAEVLAASTVRQRGPRLIASAHGDFRALLQNPDLKGLVGGSQQVTVGDSAAAQSATKSKLQTQRAGNPIFDVVVELDHVVRGRCRIIWDVTNAVDSVLDGEKKYSFETRQWDASTRGVQVWR
ncbi:hypothetical protein PR003_g2030 [Phytophthora rubi]|uniref:AAA+ ATPase domain-containing protein n=1 Tax=Phytophthora rubi TaxID=129364 RepID=A0A6A4G247_9STRA|nr:hypothetical protein PR003_g2030 [Phytophthora rubi]